MQLATSRNPTRLALPSVTIQVVPQNGKVIGMVGPLVPIFPFWYSEAKDKFWFLISLSPINGEISFDPRRVAIKTEQGGSFHVARYGGPLRAVDIQGNPDPRKELLATRSLKDPIGPFIVSDEVLISLIFEVKTFSPDDHFMFAIDGLEREGTPIEVPPLKFKNEKKRHFDFLLFDPLNFRKEWVVEHVEDEAPRIP
jgi:hypothetical protein